MPRVCKEAAMKNKIRLLPIVAFVAAIGFGHPCGAQGEIETFRRNALVQSIERVSPAVVSINVLVRPRTGLFDTGFWDFFHMPAPRLRKLESIGSGFIFDSRGYILTNYHVIEGGDYIESVTLPDGRTLEVEFVGGDSRTDIAVLRIEREGNYPRVVFGDSDDLIIGEWAIAIGNPFGGLIRSPEPSVSVGVVSATQRRLSPDVGRGTRLYQGMIQTDAAINPGNSGGPLVNSRGEVIGVNTMIFSRSGGNVGMGFAIPIRRAQRVAEDIIQFGRRRDPWPGFRVQDVDRLPQTVRREYNVVASAGGLVMSIMRGVPAYEAGLRPGDVILAVNSVPVANSVDIDFAIWDLFVGDFATLEISRGGETHHIRFRIEEVDR